MYEEEKKDFSNRLRALRMKRCATQGVVADYMGVPLPTYSNWEQGRAVPPLNLLPQLAEAFKVTLNELMGVKPKGVDEILYRRIKPLPDDTKEKLANFLDVVFDRR